MAAKKLRLSEAEAGKAYRVVRIEGEGSVKRKILDMGIAPGVILRVVGFAPLGDPMDINVKGANVSIRKREASLVVVEEVEEDAGGG